MYWPQRPAGVLLSRSVFVAFLASALTVFGGGLFASTAWAISACSSGGPSGWVRRAASCAIVAKSWPVSAQRAGRYGIGGLPLLSAGGGGGFPLPLFRH